MGMEAKVSRRQLATAITVGAATLRGQTPPPENESEAARARIRQNSEALAKVKVAMDAEPAFHFKP